ncbi:3855_t:CDS:2 [Diversispora eburnea]|uniref:3855_t:CDS:1 n=1 Tax=Diversispora eburnea TaxID=1213867 RepID=A0A9N9AV60_9GLOM|nr:3855_t:CDS:2 [Diversispora eburnea]
MPYYTDTIVRIKCVRKTEKNDSNLIIVWAIGTYPVERDDNEIEMVLFVLINFGDRDSEIQAVFDKDGFYSVGDKIMTVFVSTGLTILNNAVNSNKYLLKVSFVGVPQESQWVIGNDENTVLSVFNSDYVDQDFNFIVKIVFQHLNSWFAHLKSTIHLQDSFIFVVGQMEVIDNDFYVYAKDINFINTQSLFRQKSFDSSLHNLSEGTTEVLDNFINDNNVSSSKHIKVEPVDNIEGSNLQIDASGDVQCNETEVVVKKRKRKRNVLGDNGKSSRGRSLRSTSRPDIEGKRE